MALALPLRTCSSGHARFGRGKSSQNEYKVLLILGIIRIDYHPKTHRPNEMIDTITVKSSTQVLVTWAVSELR